jgi:hypothetical protein
MDDTTQKAERSLASAISLAGAVFPKSEELLPKGNLGMMTSMDGAKFEPTIPGAKFEPTIPSVTKKASPGGLTGPKK